MSRPQTDGNRPKPRPAKPGTAALKPIKTTQSRYSEGPFTRAFHRLVPPRPQTRQNRVSYSYGFGLIERATRMADVATRAELFYMGMAPALIVAAYFWRSWLPRWLGGVFELALAIYFGLWFVFAVFLDRRLDFVRGQRQRHALWTKMSERESWLAFRQEMAKTRAEVREQADEAKARGQAKQAKAAPGAGRPAPTSSTEAAAKPATPSIDDLLQ